VRTNARALRNDFFARWEGREGDLEAALAMEQPVYERAVATGDVTTMILAGEVVDLIGAEAVSQVRAGTAMLA
jgi:hypothetical protein